MYKEYTFRNFNIILSYTDDTPYFNISENSGYSYTIAGSKNNFKWFEQLVKIFDNQDKLLRNIEYHSTYLTVIFVPEVYSDPEFVFKEKFSIDKDDFPMYLLLKTNGQVSELKAELDNSNQRIKELEDLVKNLIDKVYVNN